MNIILPNIQADLEDKRHLPLFFLAGPCTGCWEWQPVLAGFLNGHYGGECIIAIPRRFPKNHPLQKLQLQGRNTVFRRQLEWERYYIKLAAQEWDRGAVVFWGEEENSKSPRSDGQPFAKDSHNELSEWRGQMLWNRGLRFAFGANPNFRDRQYQEDQYTLALGQPFKFLPTMQDTARRAIEIVATTRSIAS